MHSAIRRHHYRRLQKTRSKYWFGNHTSRESGIIANTPHPCSCYGGCGHMREVMGMTMQEKRHYRENINA